VALIYLTAVIVVLFAFCSLAVDSTVQLVKTQLQAAADAAALAGAAASAGRQHRISMPPQSALSNSADGAPVQLTSRNIQSATGDTIYHHFPPRPRAGPPCQRRPVMVTAANRRLTRQCRQLFFAPIVGKSTFDIAQVAVPRHQPVNVNAPVSAQANPWLAASLPDNGQLSQPPWHDRHAGTPGNPLQSPLLITGMPLTGGDVLTFASISGTAGARSESPAYQPDGDSGRHPLSWNLNNLHPARANWASPNVTSAHQRHHGRVPGTIPRQTSNTPLPPQLDFSTQTSRDFTRCLRAQPGLLHRPTVLSQLGRPLQQFVVPQGRHAASTWA